MEEKSKKMMRKIHCWLGTMKFLEKREASLYLRSN